MKFIFALCILLIALNCYSSAEEEINVDELKCEVCKATVKELTDQLLKVDPTLKVQVASKKMDAKGNEVIKMIPMRQSEVFISDKLDTLCDSMDNYARVRDKETRQIKVVSLVDPSGGMNSLLSDYDFITDSDMNKSVKYYCERLIEDYEDDIISVMKKGLENSKYSICTEATSMCSDEPEDIEEEPYVDESHIEL